MKFYYIYFFIVTLCMAQKNIAFCDEYIEYDVNYFGKFISNAKLSNSTDAILAEKRVLIIDDDLNVLSSLPIQKTQTHNCEWIFKQNSDTFFVGCQKNGESPYLVAYKSINQTHYTQFGDIVYFPNLNETVLRVTGALNTLFTIQAKKVTLFTLVISASDWSIKTTQNILDKNYFGRTNEINITDITYAPYLQDNLQYYKLMVVEYSLGAFWVDTIVKNNILSPFRNGLIDLQRYFSYNYCQPTKYLRFVLQKIIKQITMYENQIVQIINTQSQNKTSLNIEEKITHYKSPTVIIHQKFDVFLDVD